MRGKPLQVTTTSSWRRRKTRQVSSLAKVMVH